MTPLLSIIVPIYNAEKYLPKCLQSIADQTYENLEVLMVNDGSNDSSPEICRNFEEKDTRFHLISQENQGVSAARNTGLSHVSGEYLLFVDSDDFAHPDFAAKLYKCLQEHNLDTCYCGYFNYYAENDIEPASDVDVLTVFEKEAIVNDFLLNMIASMPDAKFDSLYSKSVWHGIYSMRIIREYGLHFPYDRTLSYCEDVFFHIDYLRHAQKIAIFPDHLYYYRLTDVGGSVTHSFNNDEYRRHTFLYHTLDDTLGAFLPKEKYVVRNQRLLLGSLRTSIYKAAAYAEDQPAFSLKDYVDRITHDETVETVFKTYPYQKNPPGQQIVNIFLKYHFSFGVIMLINLRRGKKKRGF